MFDFGKSFDDIVNVMGALSQQGQLLKKIEKESGNYRDAIKGVFVYAAALGKSDSEMGTIMGRMATNLSYGMTEVNKRFADLSLKWQGTRLSVDSFLGGVEGLTMEHIVFGDRMDEVTKLMKQAGDNALLHGQKSIDAHKSYANSIKDMDRSTLVGNLNTILGSEYAEEFKNMQRRNLDRLSAKVDSLRSSGNVKAFRSAKANYEAAQKLVGSFTGDVQGLNLDMFSYAEGLRLNTLASQKATTGYFMAMALVQGDVVDSMQEAMSLDFMDAKWRTSPARKALQRAIPTLFGSVSDSAESAKQFEVGLKVFSGGAASNLAGVLKNTDEALTSDEELNKHNNSAAELAKSAAAQALTSDQAWKIATEGMFEQMTYLVGGIEKATRYIVNFLTWGETDNEKSQRLVSEGLAGIKATNTGTSATVVGDDTSFREYVMKNIVPGWLGQGITGEEINEQLSDRSKISADDANKIKSMLTGFAATGDPVNLPGAKMSEDAYQSFLPQAQEVVKKAGWGSKNPGAGRVANQKRMQQLQSYTDRGISATAARKLVKGEGRLPSGDRGDKEINAAANWSTSTRGANSKTLASLLTRNQKRNNEYGSPSMLKKGVKEQGPGTGYPEGSIIPAETTNTGLARSPAKGKVLKADGNSIYLGKEFDKSRGIWKGLKLFNLDSVSVKEGDEVPFNSPIGTKTGKILSKGFLHTKSGGFQDMFMSEGLSALEQDMTGEKNLKSKAEAALNSTGIPISSLPQGVPQFDALMQAGGLGAGGMTGGSYGAGMLGGGSMTSTTNRNAEIRLTQHNNNDLSVRHRNNRMLRLASHKDGVSKGTKLS
jgi:hypothetical protein